MVCGLFKAAKKELKTVGSVNQIPFSGLNAKNRKIAGQFLSTLFIVFALIFMFSFVFSMTVPMAQGANAEDIIWATNFGGEGVEWFNSVVAVEGGYVAVGHASEDTFNTGDWSGVTAKGNYDAIIVKFDDAGNVVWKRNFGGVGDESFNSVIAIEGGYVAAGSASEDTFDTGDWSSVTGYGGTDAIIVKFDDTGNAVRMRNFGGLGSDTFSSVVAVENGYVAVGESDAASFDNGDWLGITGKGGRDAIIVKFYDPGNAVQMLNFGGAGSDSFHSVIAVEDGYVAVGTSDIGSFNTGDWLGITGKGSYDAIIVKISDMGTVVWMSHFGGDGSDNFHSVIAVEDCYVAAGASAADSFTTGDWLDITGKGNMDAIIVKFDNAGAVLWKNNFGGDASDYFYSVAAAKDGYVAAGGSEAASFNTGDWLGITGHTGQGDDDAILVKFDDTGDVSWKSSFGGAKFDGFQSVTAVGDVYVAVGGSEAASFNTGDWSGVTGKGSSDALIIKFDARIKSNSGSGSGSAGVIDPTAESSQPGPGPSLQSDSPAEGTGTPAGNDSAGSDSTGSDPADNGSSGKSYLVPLLVLAILVILGLSIFAWWKWKGNQKN